MRLLQLATSPDEVLDLHPNVSIVTGLDADGRGLLIEAVERLARAEAVSATGLLEAHGVLFDLDPDLLNLIEATESVDPIVRAVQLPTQPVSLDARELRSREDAFAVLLELISGQAEKQSAARTTLAAASAALERAHAARAEAVASSQRRDEDLEVQARRLEELADGRRLVRRQLEEANDDLEQVRGRQSDVAQRAQAIRAAHDAAATLRAEIEAELARLDAAPAEPAFEPRSIEPIEPEPVVLEPVVPKPVELEAVATSVAPAAAARIEELEQLLLAIAPVERTSVDHALAALVGGASDEGQPSADALRLADELDQIAADLARLAPAGDGDGAPSVADARRRLDEARQALLEAEQAVRTPALDRDDVLKLEDIHGELIDAIDKSDGRFGRARAAARVTELRAAEQEVLDRIGFTSYSAYMMGYSLNDTDPAKEAELDRARDELAAAEDAWAMLDGASEDELEQTAVLDRRHELLREAEGLLGHEVTTAPQAELRALRVRSTSEQDAASVLRAALDAVGIDLAGEELDHDELALIGQTWLSEANEATERRRAAEDELAGLRNGGPAHAEPVHLESADVDPVRVDPVGVDSVHVELGDAESVEAAVRGSELARDLATARDMEQSAADTLVGTEEEVASAADDVAELEAAVGRLTEELTALDAAVAEVEDALAGLAEVVDLSALDMRLESAKAVHAEAQAAMEVIDQAMATLDAEGRAEAQEIERLQDIVAAQGTGTATPAEELEWYLLARLAAQRSVSIAGSVPLLLDDALSGLGIEEACHLLTRLERMADVVQVIVVSDDPVVATWALTTGPSRAAVVSPGVV